MINVILYREEKLLENFTNVLFVYNLTKSAFKIRFM